MRYLIINNYFITLSTMENQTREQRIKELKARFDKVLTNPNIENLTEAKDTVDTILADMRMREDETKQYDEAKEFAEHNEHNDYK